MKIRKEKLLNRKVRITLNNYKQMNNVKMTKINFKNLNLNKLKKKKIKKLKSLNN